ncbi:hypothetical protein F5X99DRAFT_388341 [Biscogniauxia marginata]|nr:hypothetical protein F5X99DRAFT_388341 [Biscogniauxia marginata]
MICLEENSVHWTGFGGICLFPLFALHGTILRGQDFLSWTEGVGFPCCISSRVGLLLLIVYGHCRLLLDTITVTAIAITGLVVLRVYLGNDKSLDRIIQNMRGRTRERFLLE